MPVDSSARDINKGMYPEIFMTLNPIRLCKGLEFNQSTFKFGIITQVKMSIQQVVQTFYVMPCFNPDHQWLLFKNIDPLL